MPVDGDMMTGLGPKGATFDLRNWSPASPVLALSEQDEDQDGEIAWVGLVLMLFSAIAMFGLTGWAFFSAFT